MLCLLQKRGYMVSNSALYLFISVPNYPVIY